MYDRKVGSGAGRGERRCQHVTRTPIYIKSIGGMAIDRSEWENEHGAFFRNEEKPLSVYRGRWREILPTTQDGNGEQAMSEKLAGRGEGLKGLVAKWREAVRQMDKWPELESDACVLKTCIEQLAALEAAAPPSTAPPASLIEASKNLLEACYQADALEELPQEIDGSLLDAVRDGLLAAAALATPSPQAPQEQCNAFSPTSAREQSSATASDMLNVSELAEHITYKIQSLLTDKYTNSFRIACGVIDQELQKAVNSMPHDALVGEAFYCELSRHTCDWCGQDLRGAGFDGHYNIYCHKPDCAKHLIIPTCDCDPEYPHHCVPAATQQPAGSGALREALEISEYKCENGHTFNAQAHSPYDLPPEHCPECGNRKVALAPSRQGAGGK